MKLILQGGMTHCSQKKRRENRILYIILSSKTFRTEKVDPTEIEAITIHPPLFITIRSLLFDLKSSGGVVIEKISDLFVLIINAINIYYVIVTKRKPIKRRNV